MSIVELTAERFDDPENLNDDIYGVRFTITRAVGIPPELFVYRTETQEYSYVASPRDLIDLPVGYSSAQAQFSTFYRSDTVTRVFPSKRRAIAFDRGIRTRIDEAVLDWDNDDRQPWPRIDLLVLDTE